MSNEQSSTILMPDTLDLLHHARLGINGLSGTVDPDLDYEPYFLGFFSVRPAYMIHWSSMVSGVLPKYLEAFPLLRCMTGIEEPGTVEKGIIQSILENISGDGLIYDRKSPRRPWNVGIGYGKKGWDEDYSNLAGDGRLMDGMDFYAQLTGDPSWEKLMKRTAERILELTVAKDDYAYYPNLGCGNDFSYPRESGWVHTDEPVSAQEGAEGSTTFYLSQSVRGFIRWYKRTGDERFLEMSRKLTNFYTRKNFWGGVADHEPTIGASRAHFWGHFHGTLATLRAALEYGLAANDYSVLSFVRDGYEWAWQNLNPRLGVDVCTEGCAYADITALGIQLSLAGIGDFWDQVDVEVRNALSQVQLSDREGLIRLGEAGPIRPKDSAWGPSQDWRWSNCEARESSPGMETVDQVIDRSLGASACNIVSGRYQSAFTMQCCTGNVNQAFYFVWDAIIRGAGNTATINLLFNRFSPWLDMESYLPYEGKVILHNKKARNIQIRLPGWVGLSQVTFTVDGHSATPYWNGRYACFYDLPLQALIEIKFPVKRETIHLLLPCMNNRQYKGIGQGTYYFKGSTCIGFEDQESLVGAVYPWVKVYQKPEYRLDQAPMIEVPYKVIEKPIQWY